MGPLWRIGSAARAVWAAARMASFPQAAQPVCETVSACPGRVHLRAVGTKEAGLGRQYE